jgi:hypothetical protein
LPTVSEDDIFSAVGGLEVTQHDLDLAQHAAAAAEVFARGRPQTTVEPSRTLLVRGVPADTSDEELRGIFKVTGLLQHKLGVDGFGTDTMPACFT